MQRNREIDALRKAANTIGRLIAESGGKGGRKAGSYTRREVEDAFTEERGYLKERLEEALDETLNDVVSEVVYRMEEGFDGEADKKMVEEMVEKAAKEFLSDFAKSYEYVSGSGSWGTED